MPPARPFDTLDCARKLQSAGVPAAQAEIQASALRRMLGIVVALNGAVFVQMFLRH